jgi:hypothetical protein
MIVLFALLGAHVLRGRWLADARATATATATDPHDLGMDEPLEHPSPSVRSLGAWADASSHAVGDVTMLRRELLIGFTVAGVLSVAVPQRWWSAVFLHGHGVWTEIENALVAPLVAVVSFVCSIGNVPLAASLWQGGVTFGGVVAFLFADLIALPLVFIYRRYYGGRFTLRLVAVFYVVMAGAGLVVGSVFTSLGLVPASHTSRAVPAQLAWNYTTFLNIVFCAVALGVYVLYRNRDRLGGGAGLAIDPVCGMQVRTAEAPARSVVDGTTHWFCSERCQARFAGRSPDPVPAAAEAPTLSSDGTSRP